MLLISTAVFTVPQWIFLCQWAHDCDTAAVHGLHCNLNLVLLSTHDTYYLSQRRTIPPLIGQYFFSLLSFCLDYVYPQCWLRKVAPVKPFHIL